MILILINAVIEYNAKPSLTQCNFPQYVSNIDPIIAFSTCIASFNNTCKFTVDSAAEQGETANGVLGKQ